MEARKWWSHVEHVLVGDGIIVVVVIVRVVEIGAIVVVMVEVRC